MRPEFAGTADLTTAAFDAVLFDYQLGDSEGPALLRELRAHGLPESVPALLLTSQGSESAAVAALRAGAADYLPKSEGFQGIALERAVRRMVEQAQLRAERDGALGALQRSDARYRALVEKSAEAVSLVDAGGVVLYASASMSAVLGHGAAERVGALEFDLVHPDDLPGVMRQFEALLSRPGATVTVECRERHRDGTWCWTERTSTNLLG